VRGFSGKMRRSWTNKRELNGEATA